MASSSKLRRIVFVGASLAVLFAVWLILVWSRSSRDHERASTAPADTTGGFGARSNGPNALRLRLLPDGGVSALPTSVRIGLASVSPDDEAAYRAWLRGGREGAGPREHADLATVTRWINAPASLRADGSVEVGPMILPAAQRYVLQARAGDDLRFYEANFARENTPAELRPRVAAKLRVRAPRGVDGMGVLLRRVEGGEDAVWQSLLRREAAAVLDAYDERAIAVTTETTIAPLPPGPLDVVAVVRGLESERRRVMLTPGREAVLDLDAEAAELGAALATTVVLRLIDAESGAPVRDALAVWSSPRGEVRVRPDAAGIVRLEGADVSAPITLELWFVSSGPPSFLIEALPRWPERMSLRIEPGEERVIGGRLEKTIALQPLRWLIVETPGVEVLRRPRVADPFPVFVLQRAQGGAWRDASAESFRPVEEGVAVSLDAPGRARVAALLSPWQVTYSDAIESRVGVSRQRTRLRIADGSTVVLRVAAEARPLTFTPLQIVSALRGVPPKTMTTDATGRIVLSDATVSSLRVEAPGFEQTEVALRSGDVDVSLRRADDY
jgi:hypothetical protein